jgi:hypothetical protein
LTIESLIGYGLSFALGAVVALFWAYSGHGSRITSLESKIGKANLEVLESKISSLETMMTSMGIINLAADVKSMRDSPLFRADFQQQLSIVCSEYKAMHDQIGINTSKINVMEALLDMKK